jgi:peptide/nickel transport system permease protein
MPVGLLLLGIVVLAALCAPWITPVSPTRISIVNRLRPPSARFWFGTDDFGRDVFTRVLYGGRTSLLVGGAVVILSTCIGTVLGLLGGYVRRLDAVIARLLDAMMAFPDILLAIALLASLGASAANVVAALTIVYAPRLARVVRAATQVIRELAYVEAARATGSGTLRILRVHVLRNLVSPILVQASFIFAHAVLAEAGLSFLGVGVSPDVATWGTMIAGGKGYLETAPWIMLFPGCAIILAVLSLQLIGDGLRDALDPRLRRER